MGRICWQATSDGRYWIDLALGACDTRSMIDTGLVDPLDRIGFELDPTLWDQLQQAGDLSDFQTRERRGASGNRFVVASGLVMAQLIDLGSRQRVGPLAALHASRGALGLPQRVGLSFFHRLNGCKVAWDLDCRTWCIEYP